MSSPLFHPPMRSSRSVGHVRRSGYQASGASLCWVSAVCLFAVNEFRSGQAAETPSVGLLHLRPCPQLVGVPLRLSPDAPPSKEKETEGTSLQRTKNRPQIAVRLRASIRRAWKTGTPDYHDPSGNQFRW